MPLIDTSLLNPQYHFDVLSRGDPAWNARPISSNVLMDTPGETKLPLGVEDLETQVRDLQKSLALAVTALELTSQVLSDQQQKINLAHEGVDFVFQDLVEQQDFLIQRFHKGQDKGKGKGKDKGKSKGKNRAKGTVTLPPVEPDNNQSSVHMQNLDRCISRLKVMVPSLDRASSSTAL